MLKQWFDTLVENICESIPVKLKENKCITAYCKKTIKGIVYADVGNCWKYFKPYGLDIQN